MRRSGRPWSTSDWAASVTLSAVWHLMVLAVLALAVHPFELPDVNRAVSMELLPSLTLPPVPTVEVQLRPRQAEPPSKPEAQAPPRPQARPEAPAKAVEIQPPPISTPPPLDVTRPTPPVLDKPVEVERRPTQTPRLQVQQATPQIPEVPPEPVTASRQAPVLRPPTEVQRSPVQARSGPLDTSRTAPQLPQAATESPEAAQSAAPQVLTSGSVIQSPEVIRPRERTPLGSSLTTQGGLLEIPAPGGGQPAGGQAGGGQAGGAAGARTPGSGAAGGPIIGGFAPGGLKGLRSTLGCENPDTYKLTPEERNLCLQRFGQRARQAGDLGPNIPAEKKAEYDRYTACRRAYGGIAPSNAASDGTSIKGLGSNPSLKDCGPSTR